MFDDKNNFSNSVGSTIISTKPSIFSSGKKAFIDILLILILITAFDPVRNIVYDIPVRTIGYTEFPIMGILSIIFLALIFILILSATWILISWYSIEYTVSTNGVMFKKGVFSQKEYFMPFFHIQDINISKSIMGRLLGYQDIELFSAHDNTKLVLSSVYNNDKVYETIQKKINEIYYPNQRNQESYYDDTFSDEENYYPNRNQEYYQEQDYNRNPDYNQNIGYNPIREPDINQDFESIAPDHPKKYKAKSSSNHSVNSQFCNLNFYDDSKENHLNPLDNPDYLDKEYFQDEKLDNMVEEAMVNIDNTKQKRFDRDGNFNPKRKNYSNRNRAYSDEDFRQNDQKVIKSRFYDEPNKKENKQFSKHKKKSNDGLSIIEKHSKKFE